jgi:cytidine deaminase
MMKKNNISFSYTEYKSVSEMAAGEKELIDAANQVALNAYAPYSSFRVGAALRLKSGKIVCGANVENAAFPSGICAERSAISNAVSNYPGDNISEIAICAINNGSQTEDSISPCGNCRQVIAEEESRTGEKIKIILSGKNKILVIDTIADLLPLQFNKQSLKVNLL